MSNTLHKKAVILLLSGGLDSTACFSLLSKEYEVFPLFIDYNQVSKKQELIASEKISDHFNKKLEVLRLDWYSALSASNPLIDCSKSLPERTDLNSSDEVQKSAKTVWLPNRNGLFLNIAACFAEKSDISFISAGFNKEEAETFPDNSMDFINALNNSFKLSTLNKVRFISPTADKDKTSIASIISNNDLEDLFYSCYKNGNNMCGICESCQRTIRAFDNIGRLSNIKERFDEIPNN